MGGTEPELGSCAPTWPCAWMGRGRLGSAGLQSLARGPPLSPKPQPQGAGGSLGLEGWAAHRLSRGLPSGRVGPTLPPTDGAVGAVGGGQQAPSAVVCGPPSPPAAVMAPGSRFRRCLRALWSPTPTPRSRPAPWTPSLSSRREAGQPAKWLLHEQLAGFARRAAALVSGRTRRPATEGRPGRGLEVGVHWWMAASLPVPVCSVTRRQWRRWLGGGPVVLCSRQESPVRADPTGQMLGDLGPGTQKWHCRAKGSPVVLEHRWPMVAVRACDTSENGTCWQEAPKATGSGQSSLACWGPGGWCGAPGGLPASGS